MEWHKRLYQALMLLYPVATNRALTLITCQHQPDPASLNPRVRLIANSFYVCFEGDHAIAYRVAIATGVIVVIGFPLSSFGTALWAAKQMQGRRRRRAAAVQPELSNIELDVEQQQDHKRQSKQIVAKPMPDYSLAAGALVTYRIQRWWFHHIDTLAVLTLSVGLTEATRRALARGVPGSGTGDGSAAHGGYGGGATIPWSSRVEGEDPVSGAGSVGGGGAAELLVDGGGKRMAARGA